MKINKKLYQLGIVLTLVVDIVFCLFVFNFVSVVHSSKSDLNLNDLLTTAKAWGEDPVSPGQIGTWDRCTLDLGGGWFTSSVEYNCHDQYVCPSCTCTPIACGG